MIEDQLFFYHLLLTIIREHMSKVLKKESSPLKFDTSSANIGCFIRGNSKQKGEHERCTNSYRGRRRAKNDREKKM